MSLRSISITPIAIFTRKLTSSSSRSSRCLIKPFSKNFGSKTCYMCFDLSLKMVLDPVGVACTGIGNGNNTASPDQDEDRTDTALETVLKLYSAIKNKNMNELSDIIGEECFCISNFVSALQLFHGKKQVLDFLTCLIQCLGDHIELVVHPATSHDGMSIMVSWKLECSKTHISLGKGFSVHTCHYYKGKLIIKNLDMFIEPLLHIEPIRLKIISLFANTTETLHQDKGRKTLSILLTLLVVAAFLIFSRHRQQFLKLDMKFK